MSSGAEAVGAGFDNPGGWGLTMRFCSMMLGSMMLGAPLELAAARQGAAHETEDHEEAVNSLLGKRSAVFTGR